MPIIKFDELVIMAMCLTIVTYVSFRLVFATILAWFKGCK